MIFARTRVRIKAAVGISNASIAPKLAKGDLGWEWSVRVRIVMAFIAIFVPSGEK
jgi:hypothetical protein